MPAARLKSPSHPHLALPLPCRIRLLPPSEGRAGCALRPSSHPLHPGTPAPWLLFSLLRLRPLPLPLLCAVPLCRGRRWHARPVTAAAPPCAEHEQDERRGSPGQEEEVGWPWLCCAAPCAVSCRVALWRTSFREADPHTGIARLRGVSPAQALLLCGRRAQGPAILLVRLLLPCQCICSRERRICACPHAPAVLPRLPMHSSAAVRPTSCAPDCRGGTRQILVDLVAEWKDPEFGFVEGKKLLPEAHMPACLSWPPRLPNGAQAPPGYERRALAFLLIAPHGLCRICDRL